MALHVKRGVSTWLWVSPFTTKEAGSLFEKIAALGYDAVEIAVEDPQLVDTQAVKEMLFRNNLEAVICGAFGPTRDLTNDDERLQQTGLAYIEECLNIADDLGARFVAGPMYAAVGKARMVPAEQRAIEWERAVTNLRTVCERAAAKGLQIALEPLNRFESDLINNVDDVLRLIDDIGHPAAKVCLDMFHMNIEEPDPEAAIRKAGDKLIHMQVSENYRGTPGTGNANWDAYYRGLAAIDYRGTVSIESFTPENKELAAAVCIWRSLADSQDAFARDGYAHLSKWITGFYN
ncbi:sugar phosphate isomerase/epimerase [Parapedobacter sp. ISTM3]|uniref:D-psicose/D-tagatose/L-ribulose 3-epimerase n=1 Tax=Parapedobacter luteus TaxID=623280 RepID=A0A1T4ZW57_9SPHI|nr:MULTISPECIES: sugar phosphate isomerase/epimerase family protein [Parapedobacter]MBK1438710.1 sugar phosphate isomerase/epimerase [Parapedobacter sp. ISTM3]SKB26948.1 D-psicose/D-tagatose/L-ribulose 3-epimerase [Parapedobacter luteus]